MQAVRCGKHDRVHLWIGECFAVVVIKAHALATR
jgi:hypothetical protein